MADFKKALRTILKWEGGVSNHPADKGGLTNKGITLGTFRSVFRGSSADDLLNITDEQVEHIYKTLFWDPMRGDYFKNDSLATFVFDWIVNAGVGKLRTIQECCGLLPDGKIGPKSLAKFNNYPEDCFNKIKERRIQFYNKIGVGNQSVFLKGWLRRTNSYKYVEQN